MPVTAKKTQGKVNTVAARSEDADDEEDEIEDADTATGDTEGDTTAAKPRKPRAPKADIPWDFDLDVILAKTVKQINAGSLRGSLTAHAVTQHLKEHPAFAEIADRLTPREVVREVNLINKELKAGKFKTLPKLERGRYDMGKFAAAMEDEDEE